MTKKRRKSKRDSHSHHDRTTTTHGDGNSNFSAFDFTDEGVEEKSQEALSKYFKKNPKRPFNFQSIDKYTFLNFFTRGSTTPKIDSRNEAIDVDVSDNFLDDRRHDVAESPGSMMKSLSISLNAHDVACSSTGNTGIHNTKKHKHALHLESDDDDDDDDDIIDLQASTHLDIADDQGSLENVSAPHGSDEAVVVVSPMYVKFGKVYYTNCCLTFSSSCIELEGSPLHERKRPHHLDWSTFDIVRIEHQPSESVKANVLNFHFRIQDTNLDEICNRNSGIMVLEFVIDENQWYKKQNDIKSLDVKYEAAWETIISECSSSELFDDIVYPEGDPDSILVSSRDVELLRPMAFLNDTIIDFYIKYLVTNTRPEVRHKFHFFNTFFFRKFADMDQSTSRAWDGRKAFQRVRKWTKNIELFDKDFIFIPVNFSLHWSLIVICHPGKLANLKDNDVVDLSICPCILHMDSIRGSHRGLEKRIRSYLCEEWRERHGEQDANKFMSLRFDAIQLPQQENLSDCGLFLLHYAELFLEHTMNLSNTQYSDFLNEAWFLPAEVSLKKRDHIRKLLSSLAKEQATEDPQVASKEKYSSTLMNEGDSSVEIVNWRHVKETCDDMKFNSGIDDKIERQQSFDDMLEPENGRQPVNDESPRQSEQLLPINQPSAMRMPMEMEAIEKHCFIPRDIRSEGEADEDKKLITPSYLTSFRVGEIEVRVNTPAHSAVITPVIFDLDDEDPVNKETSTPEKMEVRDCYSSVLSEEEEFAGCIVEDSEEESGRDGIRRTRCISDIH